jgi:hypothetical protein
MFRSLVAVTIGRPAPGLEPGVSGVCVGPVGVTIASTVTGGVGCSPEPWTPKKA